MSKVYNNALNRREGKIDSMDLEVCVISNYVLFVVWKCDHNPDNLPLNGSKLSFSGTARKRHIHLYTLVPAALWSGTNQLMAQFSTGQNTCPWEPVSTC